MKSWDVNLTEPFRLEGKLTRVALFENAYGYTFADLSIAVEDGKNSDFEIPVSPLHAGGDINFISMFSLKIIDKRVSYTREVVNDLGESIMVAYRLEVLEDNGPLYAQVVKMSRQRRD